MLTIIHATLLRLLLSQIQIQRLHLAKRIRSDLPEGTHTCTLTPVRTVTPTRVTDGESTSFDFTGSAVTFSLVVDTTSPITIDTEVADSNGYTASTTPTFDVTSDEAGTLTVGGSCSITGKILFSCQYFDNDYLRHRDRRFNIFRLYCDGDGCCWQCK